jgi:hypothetical protein
MFDMESIDISFDSKGIYPFYAYISTKEKGREGVSGDYLSVEVNFDESDGISIETYGYHHEIVLMLRYASEFIKVAKYKLRFDYKGNTRIIITDKIEDWFFGNYDDNEDKPIQVPIQNEDKERVVKICKIILEQLEPSQNRLVLNYVKISDNKYGINIILYAKKESEESSDDEFELCLGKDENGKLIIENMYKLYDIKSLYDIRNLFSQVPSFIEETDTFVKCINMKDCLIYQDGEFLKTDLHRAFIVIGNSMVDSFRKNNIGGYRNYYSTVKIIEPSERDDFKKEFLELFNVIYKELEKCH